MAPLACSPAAKFSLNMPLPDEEFLGFPVHLPFGIPAGPLLNSKFVNAALDAGFDLPVYKTVRTRRYASHPWPNVLPVAHEGDLPADARTLLARAEYTGPLSITNSFGVPSFAPEFWQADIAACVAHARPGQLVIASFQGTKPEHGGYDDYIADFALGARLLRETGVQAVEVNLSCPNEGTANLLCFDARTSGAVMNAVRVSWAMMFDCWRRYRTLPTMRGCVDCLRQLGAWYMGFPRSTRSPRTSWTAKANRRCREMDGCAAEFAAMRFAGQGWR